MLTSTDVERPQCLQSLDLATARRQARSRLKRDLAKGPTMAAALDRCADLMLEAPEDALGMSLGALLVACYGVGDTHARRLLRRLRPPVSESVRLEHLRMKRSLKRAGVLRRAAG
jgi:hypothetical protein